MFTSRKNRILLSVATIAAAGIYAVGGSFAFLSDTETSAQNVFTSGAIDLTVDASSTFNGLVCRQNQAQEYVWLEPQGENPPDPEPAHYGQDCAIAWELTNLLPTHQLFDSANLKPGDNGTTVASLHVATNDAFVCLLAADYADDDPTLTDPEKKVDNTVGPGNGELGQNMDMFLWYDDGDGLWQTGEQEVDAAQNPDTAKNLLDEQAYNLFTNDTAPLTASTTAYIGFAWCVGNLQVANGSFGCQVTEEMNEIQDDRISSSFAFLVEQARNNNGFNCDPPPPPPPNGECKWEKECLVVEWLEVTVDENGDEIENYNYNNHYDDDNGDGTVKYRFKITNRCNRGLSYVAFQLPNGSEAIEPEDESTYISPFGNNYHVENTTNNPFYSIKFETLGPDGIKNGAMDEFIFTLPLTKPLDDDPKFQGKFGPKTEKFDLDLEECPLYDDIPEVKGDKDRDHDKDKDKDKDHDWDWWWNWKKKDNHGGWWG